MTKTTTLRSPKMKKTQLAPMTLKTTLPMRVTSLMPAKKMRAAMWKVMLPSRKKVSPGMSKKSVQQRKTASRELMLINHHLDQRLFNQTSGLGTGFGDEEDYNLYDKPLFADRTAASIYKNVRRETGQGNLADQLSDDGEEKGG